MSASSAVTSKEIGVAFPQQLRKSDADQVTRPVSGPAKRRWGTGGGPPSDRNGATVDPRVAAPGSSARRAAGSVVAIGAVADPGRE